MATLSIASSPIFGSSSLTADSVQRLYWLTPNATVGLSFTEVSQLLANDARFAGFRVASLSELENLYREAGIPDINVPGYGALYGTPANVPGVEFLQSLTGITYSVDVAGQSVWETAGFVGDASVSSINGFMSVNIGNIVLRPDVLTNSGLMTFASAYTTWGQGPVGTQYVGVGTWLVSSVPEPSTLASLCFGLVILGVIRVMTSRRTYRFRPTLRGDRLS